MFFIFNFEISSKFKNNRAIKKFFKILFGFLLGIVLLLLLVSVTISTPIVQTEIAHYATQRINERFHINTQIEKVAVGLDGRVLLKNVSVLDDRENTLAYTERLFTNILDFQQLLSGQLYFGETELQNLDFHIVKYKNDTLTNLDKFIATFDDGKEGSGKFLMSIKHLKMKNGNFSVIDYNHPNPTSVQFTNINGILDQLLVQGPNISAQISKMGLTDHRGIVLENSATHFKMTKTSMTFDQLVFKTKESTLSGRIAMDYKEGDLKHFTDKVNLTVQIDKSELATNDIRFFYDKIGANKKVYLKTIATGTLNNFILSNVVMLDDAGAQVIGNFKFDHLLSQEQPMKITTHLDRLFITRGEAVALLPSVLESALPKELAELGKIDVNGALSYSNFEVETDLAATTALGLAKVNLRMTQLNHPKQATYRGQVALDDFNIGKLSGQASLGQATLDLFIDGKGFQPKDLQAVITGDVAEFDFNGYRYTQVIIDGNLKLPYYKGFISSKDPNATLDFDGVIDFTAPVKKYNFVANIEHLNLNALHFIKDSLGTFQGRIELNAQGNSADDFEGVLQVVNASYESVDQKYDFENFKLQSSFLDDGSRLVEMNSPDIIEGYIKGKFKVNQLKGIVENALGSLYTNYSPIQLEKGQYFDFDFEVNNKIVSLFVPGLVISEATHLKGNINADDGDFKLRFNTPFVNLADNSLKNIDLQVDNKNPLYNTFISIDSVKLKGYDITDFNFINVTQNDTLFARTEFKGGKEAKDFYNLNMYYTINEDKKSVIGFQKSEVSFKDFMWYINEKNDQSNRIVFNQKINDFTIEQLALSHEDQSVLLSGVMQGNAYKDLKLKFESVDLNKITPSIENLSFGGLINGEIAFEQRDKVFRPTSNITIDQLAVNDTDLGQFNLDVVGDDALQNFHVNSSITQNNLERFFMRGNIFIQKGLSKLNLDAGFNDFDLKAIAPFLHNIMSDVRGDATGRLTIGGTHKNPTVDGRLYLNHAGMRPVFTGVDYVFDENAPLDVTEKQFILRHLNITDSKYKTTGLLNGVISHDKFKDWNLDVSLSSNNLLALDRKYQEGSPYYGIAFIDGFATLKGPAEGLNIKIEAKSKEGTKLKIPLNEEGGVGDNNFIHFLTAKEKRDREKGIFENESVNKFGGVQLDFEFVITPDAEIEVLLDRETGHGMKGRGAGFITMAINTLGRFNMWGDFQVYEGEYNFKYDVIIDKKLKVKKYGTIRWDGDPMNALLDLEAVYHTEANPGVLVENSAINRKIDTDVSVVLTGNLSNPDIDFLIDFPNVSSSIKSEIEYKLADKDTRQTQAMALLATGSFITSATAGNAVYGSLFERASSLFDDLFSDADGKFKVGLNYSQSESNPWAENDAARVGVTLSTRVNDRIMINGKLGVPIGGAEDNVIVGDVEVQLLLNDDGTLRARVFNRENNINYLGEGIGYTQGVGLNYEVDFDTFKDLLRKIFMNADRRAKAKKKAELKKATENDPVEVPDDDHGVEFLKFQESRREDQNNSTEQKPKD